MLKCSTKKKTLIRQEQMKNHLWLKSKREKNKMKMKMKRYCIMKKMEYAIGWLVCLKKLRILSYHRWTHADEEKLPFSIRNQFDN